MQVLILNCLRVKNWLVQSFFIYETRLTTLNDAIKKFFNKLWEVLTLKRGYFRPLKFTVSNTFIKLVVENYNWLRVFATNLGYFLEYLNILRSNFLIVNFRT